MKQIKDIVELSKKYDLAQTQLVERFNQWENETFKTVYEAIDIIHGELSENVDFYNNNLHVSYDNNKPMEGVRLFAGFQRIGINKNPEKGFEIIFSPGVNGKILVGVYDHFLNDEKANYHHIATVNPDDLTVEKVTDFVYQAIEVVQKSSLLFFGDE